MRHEGPSNVEQLRVFFRGSSQLDDAMRRAQPMTRGFLLRRLAAEGLRLMGANAIVPVEANELPGGSSSGHAVSVRLRLDGDGALEAHLRSLPTEGRVAQLHRVAALRALAAAGLAATRGAAVPPSAPETPPSSEPHERNPTQRGLGIVAGGAGEDLSHLPFGAFGDSVSLS